MLVDPNAMSGDRMLGVELLEVTRDGALLAYGVRRGGEDEIEVRILDIAIRRDLPGILARALYAGFAWHPDGTGFYYAIRLDEGPRLRFHRLGTEAADDREIFGSGLGRDRWVTAHVSSDGRYLIIHVLQGNTADRMSFHFIALDRDALVTVADDIEAKFWASDAGDALMILTNLNAANRRVLRVEFANPSRDAWRQIIAEGPDRIESFEAVGGKLIVNYLENVHSRLRVFDSDGTPVRDLELPGIGTATGFSGRWDSSEIFYSYTSYDYPPATFRYDLATGAREVWWRSPAPTNLDRFEMHQVWYSSKDGTRVPMYLFHRRGLACDGARPVLLIGYGGFNLTFPPSYGPMVFTWVEAGGVLAVANVRGGGEFGEKWHQAGRREKKQNVFDDFIAAAEWLIANRYTNPSRLAISGGSNGGLLVCATLTQRPDLMRAVICHHPVLDMIRLELSAAGRLGIYEYGTVEDPAQFRCLLAYSPYHNVREKVRYPAVLFVTGAGDTRCDPFHARKMTAALQFATASGNPVILDYHAEAGHMPELTVDATIDLNADVLAFLFRELQVASDG